MIIHLKTAEAYYTGYAEHYFVTDKTPQDIPPYLNASWPKRLRIEYIKPEMTYLFKEDIIPELLSPIAGFRLVQMNTKAGQSVPDNILLEFE